MILVAALLLLVGAADAIRARFSRPVAVVIVAVVWAAVCVLVVGGVSVSFYWMAVPVVVAAIWLATTSTGTSVDRSGSWPVVMLVATVAGLVIFGDGTGGSGFLVDLHDRAASAIVRTTPLATIALGIALVAFLAESSNLIVRMALRHGGGARVVPASKGRKSRRRDREPEAQPVGGLKGGRIIGPLERLLVVALTLSGAYAVAAALIAAKGIVRFPEISRDEPSGSLAEYFLVGSLVSFSLAGGGALLLWISVHS